MEHVVNSNCKPRLVKILHSFQADENSVVTQVLLLLYSYYYAPVFPGADTGPRGDLQTNHALLSTSSPPPTSP
jgi:hypothetical protein